MIVDLNKESVDFETYKQFKVCIVGGGPAGITLAMKLSDLGLKVLLLEAGGDVAGGERAENPNQVVFPDRSTSTDYFTRAQQFGLGGTSRVWAGFLRAFSSRDFSGRHLNSMVPWPISLQELEDYYVSAAHYLNIPLSRDFIANKMNLSDRSIVSAKDNLSATMSLPPYPIDFGRQFIHELKNRTNIVCCLNATMKAMRADPRTSKIQSVEVVNKVGISSVVPSDHFILAMGGIEAPRALIELSHHLPGGHALKKNPHLGVNFMEHFYGHYGYLVVPSEMFHRFEQDISHRHPGLLGDFELPEDFLIKKQLLSARLMLKKLGPFEGSHLDLLQAKSVLSHKIPQLWGKKPLSLVELFFLMECEPMATNNLSAHSNKGERGPQYRLTWSFGGKEYNTLHELGLNLSRFVRSKWDGRVFVDAENWNLGGAWAGHPMGLTRMGRTSDSGVVDSDLKVFGFENLFCLSSSIFCTSGNIGPTWTLLAFAQRLAVKLSKEVVR